jgi:hypothetical protein
MSGRPVPARRVRFFGQDWRRKGNRRLTLSAMKSITCGCRQHPVGASEAPSIRGAKQGLQARCLHQPVKPRFDHSGIGG